MNILRKVTWKGMWKNKTRTIVTIIGIILSAAMFMAVTTLGYSLWDYGVRREIYNSGDYFLRFDYTNGEHLTALREDDRVSKLGSLGILGYSSFSLERGEDHVRQETCAVAAGDRAFFDMVTIKMEAGRLPLNSRELVITQNIYHYLKEAGRPCEIGEILELEITPQYEAYAGENPLPAEGKALQKTYTIVGISETFVRLDDYDLYLSHLFTGADSEDSPVWYRVYIKTHRPKDTYAVTQLIPSGVVVSTNNTLLGYYGATQYGNVNTVITMICGVLAAIIMVGSVSLIYNAFSISVSERTKQFGLLSSVGATRKQLRAAIFSEAALLSAIGIPLGLLSGYVGIAITLHILSARIHTLISTGDGTVFLKPVLSSVSLAAATVVSLLTVMISAAIPAWRAAKISPIDAIRQKNDYAVPKKQIHISNLVYKLFGLPGAISRQYYRVSKKKYRATVISLVISIVLFISAASIIRLIQANSDRNIAPENFDMVCYGNRETLERVREQDFVKDAVYFADGYYMTHVTDDMLSEGFVEYWDGIRAQYDMLDKNIHNIRLIYLEDSVFRQYLSDHGLPEEPYFSSSIPTALVVGKEVTVYDHSAPAGERGRYTYTFTPYRAVEAPLLLIPDGVPSGLRPFETDGPGINTYSYFTDDSGQPVLAVIPLAEKEAGILGEDWENRAEYRIRWEAGADGITTAGYYRRDIATGQVAELPEVEEKLNAFRVQIGATARELPFGVPQVAVDSYLYNNLILPLSAAPEELHSGPDLCITVSDYAAARNYMDVHLGEHNYRDYKEYEESNRTLVLLINVFSYGFIILISLISVANVFNTISTNVALRRRDFGMLQSVGLRSKDLLRMMNYECLTYGSKALLWGIPLSLVTSYGIFRIDGAAAAVAFSPPWSAFLIAAVCVFVVVFATMFYAVSKLRKEEPIDAIRAENI